MLNTDFKEFYDFHNSLANFVINYIKEDLIIMLQSAFELLPTERSAEITDGQFVGTDSYNSMMVRILAPWDSQGAAFIAKNGEKARSFHETMWLNNKHISSMINSYYIYGEGIETIVGATSTYYSYSFQKKIAGDGVVPIWSATLNKKYKNCKGYTDVIDEQGFHTCDHLSIIYNPDVIKYIIETINEDN